MNDGAGRQHLRVEQRPPGQVLGANFDWQIRLEDTGTRQVCYKTRAHLDDPVRDTSEKHLLTTAWEDRRINWPGTSTVGVNGLGGVYASWGGFVARGARGFTVYRPEHWIFARTDLGYGDLFGAEARIFGYEVDGVDYTFRDGLPPDGQRRRSARSRNHRDVARCQRRN